jgi:WhiB family transcriptional regulator, redox-sensing transcriptional regulator
VTVLDEAGDLAGLRWQDRALCAQTDPEAFFPEKGGSARAAKRVCWACEVRAECLEYALEHDELWGIWGGLSPKERRPLKRERPSVCRSGLHWLDEANTYVYPNGLKACRACKAASEQRRKAAA